MAEYGFNQVLLLGRLVEDAKRFKTASGAVYANFRLAVHTQRPSKTGPKDEQHFIDLQRWNVSDALYELMRKGRQMYVVGRVESYRKEGETFDRQRIVVDHSIFTDNKPGTQNGNGDAVYTEADVANMQGYAEQISNRNADLEAAHEQDRRALEAAADRIAQLEQAFAELKTRGSSAPAPERRPPTGRTKDGNPHYGTSEASRSIGSFPAQKRATAKRAAKGGR